MLIVLDNAADADQIRPLLPGRSSSLVLVTSRGTLADLVAGDDAQPVLVDVLSESEASVTWKPRPGSCSVGSGS